MKKPTILLTNDDGYNAPGLNILKEEILKSGIASEVYVVAPNSNQSGNNKISFYKDINVNKVSNYEYTVDGSTLDCVILAVSKIMKDKPDLILSGINNGHNVENNVFFSGTVGGVMVGSGIYEIPSIAFNQYTTSKEHTNWENSKNYVLDVLQKIIEIDNFKNCDAFNVNFPNKEVKDIVFIENDHLRFFPIKETEVGSYNIHTSNSMGIGNTWKVLKNGYITVSPLNFNITDYDYLESDQLSCNAVDTSNRDIVIQPFSSYYSNHQQDNCQIKEEIFHTNTTIPLCSYYSIF